MGESTVSADLTISVCDQVVVKERRTFTTIEKHTKKKIRSRERERARRQRADAQPVWTEGIRAIFIAILRTRHVEF